MKFFSPAKLNLFFLVLNKRRDGFHEIASLMQAISLGDVLTFKESKKPLLTTSHPSLPCDEANHVTQALKLFQKKTGYLQPFHIHIEKHIPIGGGLGGGSSNVATTLWALNRLSGLSIEENLLRKWAGNISSDAPFFFSSGTAFIRGRGEIVEELAPLKLPFLWVAQPEGKGLSTSLIYRNHRLQPYPIDPDLMLKQRIFFNALEPTAFAVRPDLARVKRGLMDVGFDKVVMTGSGSSFFCIGDMNLPFPGVKCIKTTCLARSYDWYSMKPHPIP